MAATFLIILVDFLPYMNICYRLFIFQYLVLYNFFLLGKSNLNWDFLHLQHVRWRCNHWKNGYLWYCSKFLLKLLLFTKHVLSLLSCDHLVWQCNWDMNCEICHCHLILSIIEWLCCFLNLYCWPWKHYILRFFQSLLAKRVTGSLSSYTI